MTGLFGPIEHRMIRGASRVSFGIEFKYLRNAWHEKSSTPNIGFRVVLPIQLAGNDEPGQGRAGE